MNQNIEYPKENMLENISIYTIHIKMHHTKDYQWAIMCVALRVRIKFSLPARNDKVNFPITSDYPEANLSALDKAFEIPYQISRYFNLRGHQYIINVYKRERLDISLFFTLSITGYLKFCTFKKYHNSHSSSIHQSFNFQNKNCCSFF